MTRDEFAEAVKADPQLAGPIQAAAGGAIRTRSFGMMSEAAVIALMFPIAKHLLTQFALPWLSELGRYSELQRQKVHEWIDEKYRDEGFDPQQAEAASDALIERLELTTDRSARTAWERLVGLFRSNKAAEASE